MIDRVALGTVQFGLDYGISNSTGQIDPVTVAKILAEAAGAGVDTLDTARAYGSSETVLGQQELAKFKIVTKIAPGAKSYGLAKDSLDESIAALRLTTAPYAVLLHNFRDFGADGLRWTDLERLRDDYGIEKVGFSLYEPKELKGLLDAGITPQIIQVPYSVFDQRFESILTQASDLGIEVHTRSAFLQGLYFLDPERLPTYLLPARANLLELRKEVKGRSATVAEVCIGFVLQQSFIDRVVIGVATLGQLKQNLEEATKGKDFSNLKGLALTDLNVINPANWIK